MALLGGDQALDIVVRLKDEASKQIDAVQGKLGGFGGALKNAAGASAAFAGGVGIAIAGLGFAAKAAAEAEVATKKVEATLGSMGAAAMANKDALFAAAAGAVKLGFDDEAAAESIASLYQRTGDLTQATKLNSLAMDLARSKNIDLASASNMVGMVMSGNGKVLTQYGIEIDETKTPLEQLAELQGKVAGQATMFSESFTGQSEVLKMQLGNIVETIGEQVLPVLTAMLKALQPVIEKMAEWASKIPDLVNWLKEHQTVLILIVGAIVGALVPAFVALATMIWATVLPAIAAAAIALAPFIIGGLIIAGIVAGVLWIVQNWAMLMEKASQLWAFLGSVFKEGVNLLIGLAESWANSWVKAANIIIKALNKIKFSIPDWVPNIGGRSFGINIPEAAEISLPRLETGGTVPGARGMPVPIIAHGQETIIPAGRSKTGTGSISVVINNPTVRDANDIREMRRQIENVFRGVLQNNKVSTNLT